jgi:hypothetical protein
VRLQPTFHWIPVSKSRRQANRHEVREYSNARIRKIDDLTVAVCLRPGTELVFDSEPEYWPPLTYKLPYGRPTKLASTVARFRQINLDRRDTHHDALEFSEGRSCY